MLLGISVAAPPGPVNAAAAYQVTKSWFAALTTLLGATTADAIFFALTYYGVTRLIASGEIRDLLFLAGGFLLLYLAVVTFRSARREESRQQNRRAGAPYILGLTIGLSNPFQLAWWIAVGVGMVTTFGLSIIAGFFAGIITWTISYSSLLREGIRRYRAIYPYVVYASAALLLGFAVWFLVTAASSIFR